MRKKAFYSIVDKKLINLQNSRFVEEVEEYISRY